MKTRLKIAVLISGRGSNLQAIIDSCQKPKYPAQIVRVISSTEKAYGLQRALKAGIPTSVIDHSNFSNRMDFEAAMSAELRSCGTELVCLAGFMRLLTETFVGEWAGRLINIHPSLLPSFKGLDTHERALAAGVRIAGCTVHFVNTEMDNGPIIVQAAVPVLPSDNKETLAARILVQEHVIFPMAIEMIAKERISIKDGRVLVDGISSGEKKIICPH